MAGRAGAIRFEAEEDTTLLLYFIDAFFQLTLQTHFSMRKKDAQNDETQPASVSVTSPTSEFICIILDEGAPVNPQRTVGAQWPGPCCDGPQPPYMPYLLHAAQNASRYQSTRRRGPPLCVLCTRQATGKSVNSRYQLTQSQVQRLPTL